MKVIDITGMKFGRLTVIKKVKSPNKDTTAYWLCKCDCGNEKSINGYHLRKGNISSCGCLKKETSTKLCESRTKHGLVNTRLYRIWRGARGRCLDKNDRAYSKYGGKGVKFCEEWNEFIVFYTWAINNGYSDELSLDRINVNGNYEPSNCRWATNKEQQNNRKNTRFVEYKGTVCTLTEFAELYLNGLNKDTFYSRLDTGMSVDEAMTKPVMVIK